MSDTPTPPEPSVFDLVEGLDLADLFGRGLHTVGHLVGTAANALIEHEKAQQLRIAQLEAGLGEKEGEFLDSLSELEEARQVLLDVARCTTLPEGLSTRVREFLAKLDGVPDEP